MIEERIITLARLRAATRPALTVAQARKLLDVIAGAIMPAVTDEGGRESRPGELR